MATTLLTTAPGEITRAPSLAGCERPRPGLSRFARLVATLAFVVVAAGSLVTSTRSGDADPHWPLFEGHALPSLERMQGDRGLFIEHGHRVVAGALGILTVVLAILIPRAGEPRRWVRRLGYAAAATVVVLAALGGLRVLFKSVPWLPIVHVAVAMPFLGLCAALAAALGKRWHGAAVELGRGRACDPEDLRWLSWMATAAAVSVYIQAVLGAIPRHLLDGVMGHILWAFVVFTLVVLAAARILGKLSSLASLLRPAALAVLLVVAQFFLGFTTFIIRPQERKAPGSGAYEALASIHLAVGALLLVAAVVLAVRSWRFRALVSPSHGAVEAQA